MGNGLCPVCAKLLLEFRAAEKAAKKNPEALMPKVRELGRKLENHICKRER